MTNKINDGGAAFPRPLGDTEIESPFGGSKGIYNTSQTGMTQRAFISAMIMQGILSNPENRGSINRFAKDAVASADILIAELAKEES